MGRFEKKEGTQEQQVCREALGRRKEAEAGDAGLRTALPWVTYNPCGCSQVSVLRCV